MLEEQEKNMKEFNSSDIFKPGMLAAQAFDNILDGIQRSNLNFQLQVSPFSAQISLKKSLVRDRSGSVMLPPSPLHATVSSPSSSLVGSSNDDHTRLVARNLSLEKELSVQIKNSEAEIKALKQENKALLAKLENKSVEIKHMKCTIDDMNKEKNALNVALKSAKQDMKALSKSSENKISVYEKKINELNEFKIKKLNEERQEKIRKKKELKREAKKIKDKVSTGNGDFTMEGKDTNENAVKNDSLVEEEKKSSLLVMDTAVDENKNKCTSQKQQNCANISPCLPLPSPLSARESNDNLDNNAGDKYENIELEEKEQGFIGPKLPRMLTDAEFKALVDKLSGDKYG